MSDKCPFKRKQQIIDMPSADPSTWIPSDRSVFVCELRFSGNMLFGWKECIGEDKCPIMKNHRHCRNCKKSK